MRRISDAQRRARLVHRHHLDGRAAGPVEAVAAVVAMHASDPLTPFLGVRARVQGATVAALERALYEDRTLVRAHAVRRTLFVTTRTDAVVLAAAAGRDVAAKERRRLEGWLAAELGPDAVAGWLDEVTGAVRAALADGVPRSTTELTTLVPALGLEVTLGSGRWASRSPVSSRLLFVLAMEGAVVRAAPAGTWRSSQYRWADAAAWFGTEPERLADPAEAQVALTRRYLATHGPATVEDVRWWTGWTVRRTAAALAASGAEVVALDDGGEGYVLSGDEAGDDGHGPSGDGAPVVSFLPGLDPSPMGWKRREWFLGPDDGPAASRVYDRNGNVGPTIWVDGRIVGGWAVRADGEVAHHLFEDVGAETAAAIAADAAAVTTWLGGTAVTPRFRTPLERDLTA